MDLLFELGPFEERPRLASTKRTLNYAAISSPLRRGTIAIVRSGLPLAHTSAILRGVLLTARQCHQRPGGKLEREGKPGSRGLQYHRSMAQNSGFRARLARNTWHLHSSKRFKVNG